MASCGIFPRPEFEQEVRKGKRKKEVLKTETILIVSEEAEGSLPATLQLPLRFLFFIE